jgi:hypothetical protein
LLRINAVLLFIAEENLAVSMVFYRVGPIYRVDGDTPVWMGLPLRLMPGGLLVPVRLPVRLPVPVPVRPPARHL